MTFEEKVTDDIISVERKRPTADLNGDYVCLEGQEFPDAAVDENLLNQDKRKFRRSPWWWLKVAFSCAGLLLIGAAFALWGGPLLINKVISMKFNKRAVFVLSAIDYQFKNAC